MVRMKDLTHIQLIWTVCGHEYIILLSAQDDNLHEKAIPLPTARKMLVLVIDIYVYIYNIFFLIYSYKLMWERGKEGLFSFHVKHLFSQILWCEFLHLFSDPGVMFVLASSLVIAVASLALIQVHTQILDKLLPSNHRPAKPSDWEDEPSHLETVENFRYRYSFYHHQLF